MATSKPEARQEWIKDWLANHTGPVDILDAEFVAAYINAFELPFSQPKFGAARCSYLGRDLTALYNDGYLTRNATGLPPGDASMGFPKWVYCYSLRSMN